MNDSTEMSYRAEKLMKAASNRYQIVVQVANRAKYYYGSENPENHEDPRLKPVIRAIIEMSDEFTEPEIVGDWLN